MKKFTTILFVLLLIPVLSFSQTKIKAKDIIDQINDGKAVNYKNAEIVGDLDFSAVDDVTKKRSRGWGSNTVFTYHIKVPVSLVNCVFKDGVLGYISDEWDNETHNARFHEDVDFSGCEFEEESAFKYVEFEKDANFANTIFQEEALFKYTKFSSPVKFSKARFNGYAYFKYTEFPEQTYFDDVVFRREANFKYTKFDDGVTFENTVFSRDANFKYTKFHEFANFDDADFKNDADFKYTKLDGRSLTLYLLKNRR